MVWTCLRQQELNAERRWVTWKWRRASCRTYHKLRLAPAPKTVSKQETLWQTYRLVSTAKKILEHSYKSYCLTVVFTTSKAIMHHIKRKTGECFIVLLCNISSKVLPVAINGPKVTFLPRSKGLWEHLNPFLGQSEHKSVRKCWYCQVVRCFPSVPEST